MKKLFAICLSLVLLATCTTTAFATEDTSAGSGQTQVTAYRYSNYTITMPATVGVETGNMGSVTISDACIESGYKVDVFITNLNIEGALTLTHENGIYGTDCWFTNIEANTGASSESPLVSFYDTDLDPFGTATKYFEVHIMPFGNAGYFSGTMNYSFSCSPYEQE